MNDNMSGYIQLNEFIYSFIQSNSLAYVVDNYISLRDQYYLRTT